MMLFELPSFEHIDAKNAGEAASYLRQYGGKAKVIAGATDLLGLMKDHIEGPELEMPECSYQHQNHPWNSPDRLR